MNNPAAALHHFLYFSQLAPDESPTCVADILRTARAFNAHHDLTGVLIFDGLRFCQYLEGERQTVLPLLEVIKLDPRHVDVVVRSCAPIQIRLFDRWSMAYAHDAEGEVLVRLADAEAHLLMPRLQELLPALDAEA